MQLTQNETETEWVVNFVVDRNDKTRTYANAASGPQEIFPANLDDGWRSIIGVGLLLMVGGSLSVVSVAVGGVAFGAIAAILWWLGWLGGLATAGGIAVYLVVALIVYANRDGGRY